MSWVPLLWLTAAALHAPTGDPFGQIGESTPEGAKKVVRQLLGADASDYARVAPHLAIMLAPDFAFPLTYAKFREAFVGCSAMQVLSSRPMPKIEKPQAVRITMNCRPTSGSRLVAATADIMADNRHAFLILPGGVEHVWPQKDAK